MKFSSERVQACSGGRSATGTAGRCSTPKKGGFVAAHPWACFFFKDNDKPLERKE